MDHQTWCLVSFPCCVALSAITITGWQASGGCISVCHSVCQPVSQSITHSSSFCLSVCLSVCLSACLSVCLSCSRCACPASRLRLSDYLAAYLYPSICVSYASLSMSVCLFFVCPCLYLSPSVPLCLAVSTCLSSQTGTVKAHTHTHARAHTRTAARQTLAAVRTELSSGDVCKRTLIDCDSSVARHTHTHTHTVSVTTRAPQLVRS